MPDPKYNVLVMREDRQVRRYRLSPFWLRLTFLFLAMLLVFAIVGSYFGYAFWRKNATLVLERDTFSQQLHEKSVLLERLGNVERMLREYDPDELQNLLGESGYNDADAARPTPVDLNRLLLRVPSRQFKVKTLSLKPEEEFLAFSLELDSDSHAKSLSGEVEISLIMRDAREIPLKPQADELVFDSKSPIIITANLPRPEQIDFLRVFGLKLLIRSADGKTVLRDIYPLKEVSAWLPGSGPIGVLPNSLSATHSTPRTGSLG